MVVSEGEAEYLRRFRGATSGGEPTPLSLNAIDPMPPEYEHDVSWGDSAEYAALNERFGGLPDDEKAAFLQANRGFFTETATRKIGGTPLPGWSTWRLQHWGTESELSDQVIVERSDDGTER